MMKNSFKPIITVLFLISTLATVLMRSLACLTKLNYYTGYFSDSTLANASGWTVAAMTVLLLVSLAFRGERRELRASFRGPLVYIPAGVLAVAIFFLVADLIGRIIEAKSLTIQSILANPDLVTTLLSILLAIGAVAFCAASALIPTVRSSLRADLGMTAALFFASYAAHLFFRAGTPINHPAKIVDEMAYLAVAIFLLYETRISLGRVNWRCYTVFATISTVITAYASIPALIVYLAKGETISASIQQSLLLFAAFIFSASRLIHKMNLATDSPSGFATAIDAKESVPEEIDEVLAEEEDSLPQLSIEDIEEESERQDEE